MAIHRTRKDKENPHYNFLYSWQPKPENKAYVKRESNLTGTNKAIKLSNTKRAEIQAKDEVNVRIKKDIVRSLILVSFILILEVVVYLAWKRYFPVL